MLRSNMQSFMTYVISILSTDNKTLQLKSVYIHRYMGVSTQHKKVQQVCETVTSVRHRWP